MLQTFAGHLTIGFEMAKCKQRVERYLPQPSTHVPVPNSAPFGAGFFLTVHFFLGLHSFSSIREPRLSLRSIRKSGNH